MEDADAAPRERLARLALARGDDEEASRWATRTLHIEVMNLEAHAILAEASARRAKLDVAIEEYEIAMRLGGKRQPWLMGLARACAGAGRGQRAREALRDLLETDPEYPGARELLETLR